MKSTIVAGFLGVAALAATGQNVSVKAWLPFVNGVAVPGVLATASQVLCEAGNVSRPIAVQTAYECKYIQLVFPASAPAPVPVPAPPPPAPVPIGQWIIGPSLAPEPTTPRPARGVATPDQTFRNPVYRVTDASDPPSGFRRNDYSRRQAFSAGNKYQLVSALDGYWHIYDASTFAYVKRLNGPAGDAEPQWSPTNPDLLWYLASNGIGMKVFELNVATNTNRQVADLSARLKARWPTAMAAWTGSEGSPSADGRYWCFMVDDTNWQSLGVVTWDSQTDTILGYHNTSGNRPDHVSISPSGRYCVTSHVDNTTGTVAWTRDFSSSRKLINGSQHSDIALGADGHDIYTAVDYGTNDGDVLMYDLDSGVRSVLFTSYIGGNASAFHFSGKAFNKPGWVLVSAIGNDPAKPWAWPWRKIFLQELKPGGRVLNVAWHRATDGYFFSPVPSISRDGTRVAFTSSWTGTTNADINAFQIRLMPY